MKIFDGVTNFNGVSAALSSQSSCMSYHIYFCKSSVKALASLRLQHTKILIQDVWFSSILYPPLFFHFDGTLRFLNTMGTGQPLIMFFTASSSLNFSQILKSSNLDLSFTIGMLEKYKAVNKKLPNSHNRQNSGM